MIDVRAADALAVPGAETDDIPDFEVLYRTHARRIYSLAYRFVGNAADAEDLLQEVFLLAHRRLDSFRHEAALSIWLHRLAVNRCLDHLRSRGAKQTALTGSLTDDAPPPPRARVSTDPVTRLDLERAIASLPDGYRTVVVLRDVEGYEYREIAEQLGIAIGTAKSQVHKARRRLRSLLRRT